MTRGMLSHLRVLDMLNDVGAMAGRLFVELGAQVIKVETAAGDPGRHDAPGFLAWNAGKRSVSIEPESQAFEWLVKSADILLRPPGLDGGHLARLNPRLIDVVAGAFMPGGSNESRPATDLTLLARSGLMCVMGDPDRAPMRMPGQQALALGGIQAVSAALTALYARAASGRGQRVDVSFFQSAVHANYRDPLTWAWAGRVGSRTGNLLVRGKSGVTQVWRCADGFVTWSLVDNPPMMRAMARIMGKDAGPLQDIDWDSMLVADLPRDTLVEWESYVSAFLATRTRAELGALSAEHGLGLSYIEAPLDVLDSTHLAERDLWRTVDGVRLPGRLWRSTVHGPTGALTVPELGEANDELLGAAA
jgi:crotonobetainyl-CoA:carnitine CoA-transferase CaiB-like acyl-CoA transferase